MLIYLVIGLSSFIVAGLTFFSGFGLGTLLLPLFSLFFPVPVAVASTAVVHLLNNLSKVAIVGKHASRDIVFTFGIPAVCAAFVGARLLGYLSDLEPVATYSFGSATFALYPVKTTIGLLMIMFALFELIPALDRFAFSSGWIPLGGLLSGFFGGLSGHQGALRTMFLVHAGLSKEVFIASIAVIAVSVDVVRIFVYGFQRFSHIDSHMAILLGVASVSALAGNLVGSKLLRRISFRGIRIMIGVFLLFIGSALAAGFI